MPARRQDSLTRGAEMNFGEHEVYLREFKSVDQTKNSGFHLKILRFSTNLKAKKKKKGLVPEVS